MADIEQYLPLVEQVVVQVAVNFPRHVDRGELVRAGVLGLVEAAHRYDESRGVPFDRFAALRIRGAILDTVRQADWAPRSVRALSRRVDSAETELANRLARTPTVDELAQAVGTTRGELLALRDRVFRSVVLTLDYRANADEPETTLGEMIFDRTTPEPEEQLESRELLSYLRDAVKLLPERHRIVVIGYFLENRTSDDLAKLLGVTESRISQLRSEALVMLREGIEAQYVPTDELAEPIQPTRSSTRVTRRKTGYAAAISANSDWRDRLSPSTSVAISA